VRYHKRARSHEVPSVFENSTFWNTSTQRQAIDLDYSRGITLRHLTVLGRSGDHGSEAGAEFLHGRLPAQPAQSCDLGAGNHITVPIKIQVDDSIRPRQGNIDDVDLVGAVGSE
jgi:hypothetical protein